MFQPHQVLVYLLTSLFLLTGCSSALPNKQPLGQAFPSVIGENLEQEQVAIPQAFEGKTTLLLLGYKQDSQFDIDRWLIGLDMTETNVDVYELPTISGMFPRMFNTMINDGMRAGIPKSLWRGVITIYEGGEEVQAFTGNTNPNNSRVILLNSQGTVVYFYDRGFSVEALKNVRAKIKSLSS